MIGARRFRDRALAGRYHVTDVDLRRHLTRDGYAVIPLLDADELEAVRTIRSEHGSAPGDPCTGFYNDTYSTDLVYKDRVSQALMAIVRPALARRLPDHRALGLAHVVKWPGPGGAVPAHRDPTFVDERNHRSVMVWCPLVDVTDRNGALWVQPGSHRRSAGLRLHASDNLAEGSEPGDLSTFRILEPRAGEAVIYDHALIHCSLPNEGARERVAVAGPLTPAHAQALYAVRDGEAGTTVFAIDESFFLKHSLFGLDIDEVRAEFPSVRAPVVASPAGG